MGRCDEEVVACGTAVQCIEMLLRAQKTWLKANPDLTSYSTFNVREWFSLVNKFLENSIDENMLQDALSICARLLLLGMVLCSLGFPSLAEENKAKIQKCLEECEDSSSGLQKFLRYLELTAF